MPDIVYVLPNQWGLKPKRCLKIMPESLISTTYLTYVDLKHLVRMNNLSLADIY